MQITRRSLISGKLHTMDIPVSLTEFRAYLTGKLMIQDALPNLTPEQREFIKTGITPEEWQKHVVEEQENEPEDEETAHVEGESS